MNDSRDIRVLMIGPLFSGPKTTGGTVVAFTRTVESLSRFPEMDVRVVSSLRPRSNPLYRLFRTGQTAWNVYRSIPAVDVVLLFTTTASLIKTVSFTGKLCRKYGKPLIVRKFGGPSHRCCERGSFAPASPALQARAIEALQFCDVYLPQTKFGYDDAVLDNIDSVAWLPNYSTLPLAAPRVFSESCRKFVYMGHVKPSKGIGELVVAAQRLPDAQIDVYGTFDDGMTEAVFQNTKNVNYMGVTPWDQVIPTLQKYDAFVLPTYYGGEGHPNALMEAYAADLPIVSTTWNNIPEVVVHGKTGLLTPSRDAEALTAAMAKLMNDSQLFQEVRKGASEHARVFDAKIWDPILVDFCRMLASGADMKEKRHETTKLAISLLECETT